MTLRRPRSVLITLLLAVSVPNWAGAEKAAAAGEELGGHWVTTGYESVVKIGACPQDSALLCGDIVWLWDAVDGDGVPTRDEENPDPDQRTQPLLGRTIIIDMTQRPDAPRTASGDIYNPGDGRTYRATIDLIDATTLHVEGCVMFLCQTQVWRRPSALPRFDNTDT